MRLVILCVLLLVCSNLMAQDVKDFTKSDITSLKRFASDLTDDYARLDSMKLIRHQIDSLGNAYRLMQDGFDKLVLKEKLDSLQLKSAILITKPVKVLK